MSGFRSRLTTSTTWWRPPGSKPGEHMRHARRGTVLCGLVVSALALWGCETSRNIGGVQRDNVSPAILLTNTAGDTQDIAGGLRLNVSAGDNLPLKSVRLTFSGGLIRVLDTTLYRQGKKKTPPR